MDCVPLQKSSILLRSFTLHPGWTGQSFNKRLHQGAPQEPGRLQKKCRPQKIYPASRAGETLSCYPMNMYISPLGDALPAEQKAAGAPLRRAGFIPRPQAAPALLRGLHTLLWKPASANRCSCTQSLRLPPQFKETPRKIPEAAGDRQQCSGRQTQAL